MPNEWWGRLGLTEPSPDGGNESAENPAADTTTVSAGVQEPASDAEAGNSDPQQTVVENETEAQEKPAQAERAGADPSDEPQRDERNGKGMTTEQRHEAAARRRQADAAKLQKKTTEEVLKNLRIRNPYNENKVIETVEEYDQYRQAMADAKLKRDAKSGELSIASLEEAIMASPRLKKIVDEADALSEEAKAAQEDARKAQYQADMRGQIAEIQRINPQIKSINDIISMDTGAAFAGYVQRGLTPVEAYKLANHDAIISRTRSAAEQAARNSAASTQHLQATGSSTNGVEVSAATKARYRTFCPNATDAQIAAMEKTMRGK